MITFTTNGELVVQQRNVQACQQLEYTAMLVTQYCKETKNRDKRLYDLRGVMISAYANDLKDFVKGYIEREGKKRVYEHNVSASMLEHIAEALEIFGDVYDAGSFKTCAKHLKEQYPQVFMYSGIISKLSEVLKSSGFVVTKCESTSTSSVYLDVDYKNLSSIRISDHKSNEFKGIQILMSKGAHPDAGKNGIFCIREEEAEHDLEKVIEFVSNRLRYERNAIMQAQYQEALKKQKPQYKEDNDQYKGVN